MKHPLVSEWTDKLCNALVNIPLTDILDKIEKELADQSPQVLTYCFSMVCGIYCLFAFKLMCFKLVGSKTRLSKVHMQMESNQNDGVLVVTSLKIRAVV